MSLSDFIVASTISAGLGIEIDRSVLDRYRVG